MPEAKPAGRGRKLAKAVAVQAPEAKPTPVQIGPSKDAPEAAGQNRAGRRRHSAPRRPACSADGNPSISFRARADRGAPSPAPGGPRQAFLDLARLRANGLIEAPVLDSPPRQGRHARACPSRPISPPHPIGRHAISRVEPAFNGRTNPAALTGTGASHREAGRADPRSMEKTRARRSEAAEQTRGSAGCEHPAEPHHLAPTGPAGRRSKIIRMCRCAVGGGE